MIIAEKIRDIRMAFQAFMKRDTIAERKGCSLGMATLKQSAVHVLTSLTLHSFSGEDNPAPLWVLAIFSRLQVTYLNYLLTQVGCACLSRFSDKAGD